MQRPEVLRWQSSVGGNVVTVRVLSMPWWLSWCGGWDLEWQKPGEQSSALAVVLVEDVGSHRHMRRWGKGTM